jgi:hypothetical protein
VLSSDVDDVLASQGREMNRRNDLQDGDQERDPRPLYVVVLGLLLSIASYDVSDEVASGKIFGVGLVIAGLGAAYRLVNPNSRND